MLYKTNQMMFHLKQINHTGYALKPLNIQLSNINNKTILVTFILFGYPVVNRNICFFES